MPKQKHIMKLRKVSTHSYAVTLPKQVIRDFGWRERQKLTLTVDPKKKQIQIKDWKK